MADTSNKAKQAEEQQPSSVLTAEEQAAQDAKVIRREQYDALIADLKARQHVWNDRRPLAWAAFDAGAGEASSRAGKHVVAIQYAAAPGGNGGLLRELVFDFAPGDVKTQEEVHDGGLQ